MRLFQRAPWARRRLRVWTTSYSVFFLLYSGCPYFICTDKPVFSPRAACVFGFCCCLCFPFRVRFYTHRPLTKYGVADSRGALWGRRKHGLGDGVGGIIVHLHVEVFAAIARVWRKKAAIMQQVIDEGGLSSRHNCLVRVQLSVSLGWRFLYARGQTYM